MKKISVKTFYLIAVISIGLIGLAVGSTYAMFTTSAEINNPITISSNLTSNNDVMETFEVEIEPYKTVTQTININSDTIYNVNYTVWYLNDVTGIEAGILSTNTQTTGIINAKELGIGTTCNIVLRNNSAEKKIITIGVATSKNNIVLASNMIRVPQRVLGERQINTNAATYIKKLYSTAKKSTVTNNITYNTSPSQLLINDRKGSSSTGIDAGNIRYYGADPDNYVYFNCSDYSNPTSSTCEKWRIIGVFDGKVKIMRSESIGAYSWDTTDPTTNSGAGYSDWSTSKLMMLLNSGYTYLINNFRRPASLYWNRTSGTCFNAENFGTTSCNFTSTGLKNDETKNMISETTYNIGGGSTSEGIYANQLYTNERGTTVYTGRPTTWTGKVAIPYASDYGYAANFNKCSSTLYNYSDSTCTSNNWMYNIMTSSGATMAWTLTPQNTTANHAFAIHDNGRIQWGWGIRFGYNILPTLYLNPDTIITKGEGTKDSPYKIKYDDSVKGEYFNGTTNYKTLGFTNYNSATISLVARFKIESYNSGVAYIFGNPEGAGSGLYLKDGKPGYEVFYSSNSSWTEVNATNRVSLNKWHTLVGTYESGTQKLYLDGTLVASTSSGVGTLVKTSTAPFAIGVNPTDTGVDGTYFNGYISDVLAINSSLTSGIVSSYYGSNFNRSYNNTNTLFKYTTEGSSYKLKGYNLGYASDGIQLQLDGKNNRGYSRSSSVKTWYDLSNNQNNGTITGTTWGSNYLSFASSSDHVEKTSAKYNISSAYTIEIVLRPINQISTYQMIFSTVNTGTGVKQYMSLWSNQVNSTYSNASYRIENADGTNHKNSYYAGIEKNTAYTLTAALNGTKLKIYKNGSLVNSETLTFTPKMSESGMYISSSSYPFDGYIYSIRVYNRELSASEISANYQNDKSRFGF